MVTYATPAFAQEPAQDQTEPASIKLFVDVEESDVRIESRTFRTTCSGPCVVSVPPGYYTVTAPSATKEVYVDRPTRVRLTRGSPGAKTVSLALLIGGAAVAVAALLVPILVCRDTRYTDLYGRQTTTSGPCNNISTPVQIAWIAGGGVGLTVGLVGGIGLAFSGPRITTGDWNAQAPSASAPPKRSVAPAAGLSLQVSF